MKRPKYRIRRRSPYFRVFLQYGQFLQCGFTVLPHPEHLSFEALAGADIGGGVGTEDTGVGGWTTRGFSGAGGSEEIFGRGGNGGMLVANAGFTSGVGTGGVTGRAGSAGFSTFRTGGIFGGSGVGRTGVGGAGTSAGFFGVNPRMVRPPVAAGPGSCGGSTFGSTFRLKSQNGQVSQSPVNEFLHFGHVILGNRSSFSSSPSSSSSSSISSLAGLATGLTVACATAGSNAVTG